MEDTCPKPKKNLKYAHLYAKLLKKNGEFFILTPEYQQDLIFYKNQSRSYKRSNRFFYYKKFLQIQK